MMDFRGGAAVHPDAGGGSDQPVLPGCGEGIRRKIMNFVLKMMKFAL